MGLPMTDTGQVREAISKPIEHLTAHGHSDRSVEQREKSDAEVGVSS